MSIIKINSFGELLTFLRTTETVTGGDEYDFVGMVMLFKACLDNLQTNALEAELEDIGDQFTEEQIAFLKRLAALMDH